MDLVTNLVFLDACVVVFLIIIAYDVFVNNRKKGKED